MEPTQSRPNSDILFAAKDAIGGLEIRADGRGTLTYKGEVVELSREIGRFTLRRVYLGDWVGEGRSSVISLLVGQLQRSQICHRPDCVAPIPRRRQLMAFDRDQPAKYCSVRCQRTEASRRFVQRHKTL